LAGTCDLLAEAVTWSCPSKYRVAFFTPIWLQHCRIRRRWVTICRVDNREQAAAACQAEMFCGELHEHTAQLEEQAAKFRAQMARYTAIGQHNQVKRLQSQLRMLILERRHVANMLASLGHAYPCQHAHAGHTSPQRQLLEHSTTA
jgi:hypothetical protein